MTELAVTDGMPPPGDLPDGECVMTTLYDDDDGKPVGIRVNHADPRILIAAEVLALAYTVPLPGIILDSTTMQREHRNGTPFWTGAVLKIEGVNRTVIYCIREYVPRVHGYIAEWPD